MIPTVFLLLLKWLAVTIEILPFKGSTLSLLIIALIAIVILVVLRFLIYVIIAAVIVIVLLILIFGGIPLPVNG